jgi:cytochrome b subunit of formate dehydrogenase
LKNVNLYLFLNFVLTKIYYLFLLKGVMKALIAGREHQKRGLHHTHSVYWLDEIDGIKTNEQLDQIIRAEIPDRRK